MLRKVYVRRTRFSPLSDECESFDDDSGSELDLDDEPVVVSTVKGRIRTNVFDEWDFDSERPKFQPSFRLPVFDKVKNQRFYMRGNNLIESKGPIVSYGLFPDRLYIQYARNMVLLFRSVRNLVPKLKDPKYLPLLFKIKYCTSPYDGYFHKRGTDGWPSRSSGASKVLLGPTRHVCNILSSRVGYLLRKRKQQSLLNNDSITIKHKAL